MNFLAHLALSHFSIELQIGNFLGDFTKGRKSFYQYEEEIRRGILMHREIDLLTDRHPGVKELNHLLKPQHGRYASIVTDICFDYCLYKNWDKMGPAPFETFTQVVYDRIKVYRPVFPHMLQDMSIKMVNSHWLRLYTTTEGMSKVFARMAPRVSHPEKVMGAEIALSEHALVFDQTFNDVYPDLCLLADTYR